MDYRNRKAAQGTRDKIEYITISQRLQIDSNHKEAIRFGKHFFNASSTQSHSGSPLVFRAGYIFYIFCGYFTTRVIIRTRKIPSKQLILVDQQCYCFACLHASSIHRLLFSLGSANNSIRGFFINRTQLLCKIPRQVFCRRVLSTV